MAKLTLSVNLESPAMKALLRLYPGVTPQRAIVNWINASHARGHLDNTPSGLTLPAIEDQSTSPQEPSSFYSGFLDEE